MAGRAERIGAAPAAGRRIWLAASALLLVAAALVAGPALARGAALLAYPYPHDGLEGTLLYEARLMRAGEPLYRPLELHRFFSAPYPPVHPLLLALADLIPGPHVFWGGRLLSALAGLAACAACAALVRRSGAPWAAAALAAALLLSAPPLQLWGTRIKPDVTALALTTCGLALAAAALAGDPRRRMPPSLALAAACFAAAFFTKQTAVAGALAAGLALLASDLRGPRGGPGYLGRLPLRARTLAFAGLYLALALGVWALLDALTAGQYTLHVWWGGRRSAWWSFALFSKLVGLLGFWWPLMPLAALAVPLAVRRPALALPACYALAAPLSLLGAGEQGSNTNHLLEAHAAIAVASCAALGALMRWAAEPGRRAAALGLLAAGALLAGLGAAQAGRPPDWYAGELSPEGTPERYLAFIRGTPGEILADDTGLLFQAGRDLRYDDPSTMGPAAAIGAWDQRGLLEDIAQQKFSAIMIPVNVEKSDRDPSGRWTPEMLAAIRQHYRLKFKDTIYTYVPR